MSTVQNHPAETGGALAAAVALLLVDAFGIHDVAVYSALVIVVGAVPSAITWGVNIVRRRNGGPAKT